MQLVLPRKLFTLLDLCVSSLRRGHANLLCIVPILTDDPRRDSVSLMFLFPFIRFQPRICTMFCLNSPYCHPIPHVTAVIFHLVCKSYKLQKAHCRHRSHFGSRYKLGCCGNASLFSSFVQVGSCKHSLCFHSSRAGISLFCNITSLFHICVRALSHSFFLAPSRLLGACPCCPSGPWRRSVREYIMSCKSCGWLTPTKQVVCKDPAM